MSLDDIRLRETIDLAERVQYLREDRIPKAEARIADAEEQAADEDADAPDPTPEELRDLRDRLAGQADAMQRVVDALGDGRFTIQELMTAETSLLQDDVAERAIDVDYDRQQVSGTPKEGYHRVRTLQLSLVEAPDRMDAQMDRDLGREVYQVGKLPDLVSDYLYQCVTSLNESGDIDGVGDFSRYLGESDAD